MLHSFYGMNAARLNSVTATLQRMQDDPEAVQRSIRRFDDDPPPPYSPASSTRLPTPALTVRSQLTAHETDELIRRPLNNDERDYYRRTFHAYAPEHQFFVESGKEREHILAESLRRDSEGRYVYRGPDISKRPGDQRLDIMVRNGIRKRWESLGVWNPEWGIPGRVKRGDNDNSNRWNWKWSSPRRARNFYKQPFEVQVASWPPQEEEYPDERAIRQHLERKGEWSELQTPPHPDTTAATHGNIDPDDSRITTRPWYQWKLEVREAAIRSARVQRASGFHGLPDCEKAAVNITERWKANGDWKDSWGDSPGWKWKHESPSPEPEDPNEMDFSPSEIDALESIPPPTPPSPFNPTGEHPDPVVARAARLIFGHLKPGEPLWPTSAQSGEEPQTNDQNKANSTEGLDDSSDVPDGSPSPSQNHLSTALRTRSLRKRKRDDESGMHARESSPPQIMHAGSRQQKRSRTGRSASQPLQQPAQTVESSGTVTHGQPQVKKGRTHATRVQPLPEPRRSARIAQLQKARARSVQSAKAGLTRKRRETGAPRAALRTKRSNSKRPKTLSLTDNRHQRPVPKGAETRTGGGRRLRPS
ncbi:hypothetical protein BU26DRAFT_320319 [Trematosphaeria pertusa]|uniref:Uncharacterized protein n=1 Tax=Trematosphaeria pertusa TaxID=390896 RepID=A0A6A6IHR9_9PLEO|nr:uncharacterized protein BU26DRAFT_320319 [Trematosphaeria pertusa]KAF2249588.1 hypothetical protein BU26DRAFT_320319 [Trematosphaeria pertusa]